MDHDAAEVKQQVNSFCKQYVLLLPQGVNEQLMQTKAPRTPPGCIQGLSVVFIIIHILATVLLLANGSGGVTVSMDGSLTMEILLVADIMTIMAWILFGIQEFELAQKLLYGATLVLFLLVTLIVCNLLNQLASIVYCNSSLHIS